MNRARRRAGGVKEEQEEERRTKGEYNERKKSRRGTGRDRRMGVEVRAGVTAGTRDVFWDREGGQTCRCQTDNNLIKIVIHSWCVCVFVCVF